MPLNPTFGEIQMVPGWAVDELEIHLQILVNALNQASPGVDLGSVLYRYGLVT